MILSTQNLNDLLQKMTLDELKEVYRELSVYNGQLELVFSLSDELDAVFDSLGGDPREFSEIKSDLLATIRSEILKRN